MDSPFNVDILVYTDYSLKLNINGRVYNFDCNDTKVIRKAVIDLKANRNKGLILSFLKRNCEWDEVVDYKDTFPRMPWEEKIMRIEKEIKKEDLITITEDIKIGSFILEKGDKVKILKEKAKWNSGFSGYVITDIAAGNVKRLEAVLLDNDVAWDALLDMGWTQFITDIQDKDQWKDFSDEVYRRTGLSVYDSYKNQ